MALSLIFNAFLGLPLDVHLYFRVGNKKAHGNLWVGLKCVFIFFKDFIYLFFREKGKEGQREGEKNQCVVAPHMPPFGDLAHKPGICSDWELNWWLFGSQAHAPSNEPYQPGLKCSFNTGCSSEPISEKRPASFTRSCLLTALGCWGKTVSVPAWLLAFWGGWRRMFGTLQSVCALLFTPSFLHEPQLLTWSSVPQSKPSLWPNPETSIALSVEEEPLLSCKSGKDTWRSTKAWKRLAVRLCSPTS